MKKISVVATSFFLSLLFSQVCFSQFQSRIRTIIVDAGHGGNDQGAKGTYSTEAELTLKFAIRVGELLQQELPDTKIIQTRTSNVTQSVREKAAFANENKGDLFVCIHVNAAPPIRHSKVTGYRNRVYYTGKGANRKKHTKKQPVYQRWTTPNPRYGTGTYVWAADRDVHKADAVSERFESEGELTDAPDPATPEGAIASRLWVQKYFKNSVRLASMIESEFEKDGRKSDGVLQRNEKGIWVLQATNMPAVLIETGFITNKEEEDYLNSEKGQSEVSQAIVRAVVNFKNLLDSQRNGGIETSNAGVAPTNQANAANTPDSSNE